MKVALCTEVLYPLYGVERRVYEMARRLPRLGFDATVYTSTSAEDVPELDVVQVSGPTITKPPNRSYASCFSFWYRLYRRLLKDEYDVIDANGHMALVPCSLAASKRKKPSIATIHDLYLGDWRLMQSGLGGFLGLPFELLSARMRFDKVITLNKTVRKKMAVLGLRNIGIIPSGIDIKYIDGVKAGRKKNNLIVYAGRLVPQKNVDVLIRAFEGLKDAELHIIGEGSERNNLEKLARSLNLRNIRFITPYKRHEDLIRTIKEAAILVMPSKRENFGIVPLESMRCGTAVVSTNTDGPRDYMKNGVNGFLTEIGDSEELKKRVKLLLDDKNLRKRIERSGRKTAESYDWNVVVKKISLEYRKLL